MYLFLGKKISVVVATYNGEKFIIEQLDSIINQSVVPDEVIVADDCSSDNSLRIINEYVSNNHLDYFKIYKNERNLGWKANFMRAIENASGDIIFTCDQDDIWKLDKIEKMSSIICKKKEIKLLVANYAVMNMRTTKTVEEKQIEKMVNDDSLVRINIDKNFHIVSRPGCTFCFQKKLFDDAKKLWINDFAHDRLLWTYAILNKCLYKFNHTVIDFRRHDNNATGFSRLNNTSRINRANVSVRNAMIVKNICNASVLNLNTEERNIVDKYIAFESTRAEALDKRKICLWIKYNIWYGAFVYSLKSSIKDLFYLIKK